jgi:hypothetical protein
LIKALGIALGLDEIDATEEALEIVTTHMMSARDRAEKEQARGRRIDREDEAYLDWLYKVQIVLNDKTPT